MTYPSHLQFPIRAEDIARGLRPIVLDWQQEHVPGVPRSIDVLVDRLVSWVIARDVRNASVEGEDVG